MNSKYIGNDNYGRPKSDYIEKIEQMDYTELFSETKDKIWLSAYANNNPRSDYHWQCDGCYDEWLRRNDVGAYKKAWDEVYKQEFGLG